MKLLVNVGYGNLVNKTKVVAIVHADSSPVRRMIQKAKEEGILIDATQGRKTQSVLVMENGAVVLSAMLPETLSGRFENNHIEYEEKQSMEEDA